MHTIQIIFISLLCLAGVISQPKPKYDYDKAWKQVQKFENEGLPQSALKIVDDIYQAAQKENNSAQLVKAIIHQMKFLEYREEDGAIKNMQKVQDELEKAPFPVKPLLHSMLAEMYWGYYQNDRWRFNQRSETIQFDHADIATWSLEQIVKETVAHYEASLLEAEKSKNTFLDIYKEILEGGNTRGRTLRTTLYDFLAHRAVDFFMNDEPDITQPAYVFTIDSAKYLSPAADFIKLSIATKDTLSYKYHALQILQDLLALHINDEDPTALTEVDLNRLNYVQQRLTLPDKNEHYLKALQQLETTVVEYPVSTKVTLARAQVYMQTGNLYQPLQSDDQEWDYKTAYEICGEAIARFRDSEGAVAAEHLHASILTKNLAAIAEATNLPEQPFRALVTYKNMDQLYWRAIPTKASEIKAQREKWRKNYNVDREKKFIEYFAAKDPLKTGSTSLPDQGDYQSHKVEVKIDDLPVGDYMILFSHKPDFSAEANGLAYAFTTVSNLAYIHRNTPDGGTDFFVMHRQSGQPLAGVKAQAFFSYYNNGYKTRSGGTYISNDKGYFRLPYQSDDNRRDFYVELFSGKDHISTHPVDQLNSYGDLSQYQQAETAIRKQTYFFLDRAIYRPGQTLYFKGLVTQTEGKDPKILKQYKTKVQFMDANYQQVAEQEVTTNQYGTFSGTFTTPSSGLTGQMSLIVADNTGTVSFSVEEYKRPKFEVTFEPVKGTYRLGDSVQAVGQAKAYSGANIDGAQVSYRVMRQARFPYWWYCHWGYYPSSPEVAITQGVTETDAEGKFKIDFLALPDASVDPASDPTFSYQVYADVTDINGETHSSQTAISAGYKSLLVGVGISDLDQSDKEKRAKSFEISTTNLSGEFESAQGQIKIFRLKDPDKAFRKRPWERPDQFVMSQQEYYQNFPQDAYQEEDNSLKWEREQTVLSLDFDTEKEKSFSLDDLSKWEPGKYGLEITAQDRFGQPVKEEAYFTVYKSKDKRAPFTTVHWYTGLQTQGEPGEVAKILVGSTEKIQVLYEVEKDAKILQQQWFSYDDKQECLEIPINESHRGNLVAHYTFIKDNRFYHETTVVTVPYTNKELEVTFETFRDKLLPGETEEWKIKIKGKQGDMMAAEMVATLYDASLDAFRPHHWYANFYQSYYARLGWQSVNGFNTKRFSPYNNNWNVSSSRYFEGPAYDYLNWFGYYAGGRHYPRQPLYKALRGRVAGVAISEVADEEDILMEATADISFSTTTEQSLGYIDKLDKDTVASPPAPEQNQDFSQVKVRSNFNETAFFYPHLMTNEAGEIIVSFTVPEALTRWKMLGFAHTPDLKSGSVVNELVTQKDLMVVPNQPRFFRENDQMTFSTKITSLAEKALSGQARLEFFDALTMESVDDLMKNSNQLQDFTVAAKQSTALEWNIEIPEGLQAVMYRIVAQADNFSDGEEMAIPVMTNRMMVTESLPLPIRGNQTKTFEFTKLASNTSTTLKHHRLTLEFTSNPAWYAVQALPYMMEYPYECTEQVFSRYYANSLASHIANAHPKIRRVFDTWKSIQPEALLSNLEKNQELKTALLEETPWVLQAQNESQRKRRLGLLFDLNRMADEQARALDKIRKAQYGNGGFPWFPGLPEDRYITQHIIAGMGHLDVLGVKAIREDGANWQMVQSAMNYLDSEMAEDYRRLKALTKKGQIKLSDNHLNSTDIHYLYTRSYFKDIKVANQHEEAFNYYLGQAKEYWLRENIYLEGMVALALHRFGDSASTRPIIQSLKERALHSEELGMYWKSGHGYYWYQAPIETQALMIEVFDEVAEDQTAVEDLKVWLLKQKQTQDWKTTKATAEACYALLRRGTDLLVDDQLVTIKVGGQTIDPKQNEDTQVEAGTGYFKTTWAGSEIKPEMGHIEVSKNNDGVAWGAVYWQYFEQLDKMTPAATPLQLNKKLFKQLNTERGPVITPITDETELKVGDLVQVRIELRVDRNMEYVHLKDMRAAGFEPMNTLSTHKYQDGLWYYENTRDLATNFFMAYLPKGTYVFEYPLRVSQKGDFSNGITTIQSMYAPEFASHSEGIRVRVE